MSSPASSIPPLPKCECGQDIPGNVTLCIVCSTPVGFPNVRYAARTEERRALDQRVADARISATARGSLKRLEAFGEAVAHSRAVVSRELGDLQSMLSGDGKLMQAYHPAVRAGLRIPQNNEFDPERDVNDARISPLFYASLHFAALSLNSEGVPHYGRFAITLREDKVAKRSTVFEENPVKFNDAHPPGRNKPVPYGFRATWSERHKLAMAKLQPKIEAETSHEDFPDILLEKAENVTGYSDFIEVHVYGDVHPRAFEHIRAIKPDDELDVLLWERMKARLAIFDITFEEVAS